LPDEIVGDAVVAELAGESTARRAETGTERHARERVEEQEPDQRAPKRARSAAGERPAPDQRHRLVEVDLPVRGSNDDTRVLELAHVLLLQSGQLSQRTVSGRRVLKVDTDQICPDFPPWFWFVYA
jgi:hypothetical protein